MLGALNGSNAGSCQKVVAVVECPAAYRVGQCNGFVVGHDASELSGLSLGERNVPETDFGGFHQMLFAAFISKEESGLLHLPDIGVARCALSHLISVKIDGDGILPDNEEDAVPLLGRERTSVAQTVGVQTKSSVFDEETAVLAVGGVILVEGCIVVQLFHMDVHEKGVVAEALFFEVCGHV